MNDPHNYRIVLRHSGDATRVRALGPYLIESLLDEGEEHSATAYCVRIEPQQRTEISYHKIAEEFYFVVSGSGTALIDGKTIELSAGDFLRLPPGTTHGFITRDAPLEMLDIHIPGCRPNRDVYFMGRVPPGFG